MCKVSDDELVRKSFKSACSVQMLKRPPSWAYTSSTSTDWSLIKKAKAMRGLSPASRLKTVQKSPRKQGPCVSGEGFAYDLALDVSGLSKKLRNAIRDPKKTPYLSAKNTVMFIMIVFALVVAWLNYEYFTIMTFSKKPLIKRSIVSRNFKQDVKPNRMVFKPFRKEKSKNSERQSETKHHQLNQEKDKNVRAEKAKTNTRTRQQPTVDNQVPKQNVDSKGQVNINNSELSAVNLKLAKHVTCTAIHAIGLQMRMMCNHLRQDSDLLFILE